VKVQLRNLSRLRMPTPLGERKAASGTTANAKGGPGSPESLAQGMFVRRGKVVVHSGCKTRPGTGSLHPEAIGAARGITDLLEPPV
jgi:hypothetical protein